VRSALIAVALAAAWPALAQAPIPVKLGILADMGGTYSDIGGPGVVEATKLAIEDFAKRPGGNGLKVDLVAVDSQNKPDISAGIARRWFDTEDVDAVLDLPTSAIALALAPIVQEKNKVALVTAAAASDITGKACTPNTVHWTYDTWSVSRATAAEVTKGGGKSWFFVTADYAFGHALERDASAVVVANGGRVIGAVRHPLENKDFSSFLLQAQASGADVIGLTNAGNDAINAIKQAAEFGIGRDKQKLAGMLLFITDIHSLGLKVMQKLQFTTAFYWGLDEKTRAFGERFAARYKGRYPSMTQAGAYSATLAYLSAVQKVGSAKDGRAVLKAMREMGPIDDPLFGPSTLREDFDGTIARRTGTANVTRPIVWALGTCAATALAATATGGRLAELTSAAVRSPATVPPVSKPAVAATPAPSFSNNGRVETIPGDRQGHFAAEGRIDGTRIALMVDTGASLVVLREEDAERVGIHLRRSDFTGRSSTANGTGSYAPVTLRSLRIGEIEVREVPAAVVPRGQLGMNLLGMSFLRRLRSFDIADNRITLRG
jgi:branched-chain amino acid transport system substrate-binding protein